MLKIEPIACDTKIIACGKDPSVEHPIIYLDISGKNGAVCPYCSRHYIYKLNHKKANEINSN